MCRKTLDDYRSSAPVIEKNCKNCGISFKTKFGTFCSSICRIYNFRKNKLRKNSMLIGNNICFFCGINIKTLKFCCEEHRISFNKYKREGKKIPLRIDTKSVIYTDKYERIPEIIKKYKTHFADPESGPPSGGCSTFASRTSTFNL